MKQLWLWIRGTLQFMKPVLWNRQVIKVLTIPAADGKMRLEDLEMIYNLHRDEHMVKPRLIYLSQTTELGTVYQQKN